MIVVLDSGVWVSALAFGGTPRQVVEKALACDQVAICDLIQNEVTRILVEKNRMESESSHRRLELLF